jgi:hypothetical protein
LTLAGKSPDFTGEPFQTYDIPWSLELKSGSLIHAAYWHDRFGIEHGNGSIQLSPTDAARVWRWATPDLPVAWHGVTSTPDPQKTFVVVRK